MLCFAFVLTGSALSKAGEPNDDRDDAKVELDAKVKILKVDGAESLARDFSLKKATDYLDRTAMAWTNKYKCFTCHTNYLHLIATSDFETKPKYYKAVQAKLGEMVTKRWKEKGPRWDAEVVMSAATLAFVDRHNGNQLNVNTRMALDKIWEVQRDDGGFDWLQCDWPPMESDDEYGAAIAAVGVSAAPENYQKSAKAKAGIAKLKKYIQTNGLKKLHHQAMLIWAESLGGEWISEKDAQAVVDQLLKMQKIDGGWNTPSIGDWERDDDQPADRKTSDGYGTGFAIFILKKAGLPNDHAAIQKGIQWLKENQRESGRWYTRSVSRDNKHFLTHAGTAMAIMALRECETQ